MSIERFHNQQFDKPGLQELSFEKEKIPEVQFDPEWDITSEDWSDIVLTTGHYKDIGNWENFATCNVYAKLLRPGREKDSSPIMDWAVRDITQYLRKIGEEQEAKINSERNYSKFDAIIRELVELDPTAVHQDNLENGPVWDRFIENAIVRNEGVPEDSAPFIAIMKSEFPGQAHRYPMKEENWQHAKEWAKNFAHNPNSYLGRLANLRLADPERYKRDKLGLSEQDWQAVHQELEFWRTKPERSRIALLEHMYHMAIVAARDVEYGPGGATIDNTYYPDISAMPPIPTRPKFTS